jgi:sulfite exporter TauE/SafE
MAWSLLLAGLLLGLGGGLHCAAMCGPLARAVAGPGWLSFQAGRLASYMLLGSLAGLMGELMAWLSTAQAALRPVWTLTLVGVGLLGASWLVLGREPAWWSDGLLRAGRWWQHWRGQGFEARATVQAQAPVTLHPVVDADGRTRWLGAQPLTWRGGLMGLLWAGLPCGLLYSAALLAWMSNAAWQGALVMLAFALGSGLFQALVHAGRVPRTGGRWQGWVYRGLGTLCIAWAVVGLWSLTQGHAPADFCLTWP